MLSYRQLVVIIIYQLVSIEISANPTMSIFGNKNNCFNSNYGLNQSGYPKRSPYLQQNFTNFGVGPVTTIMPIKNQIQITQNYFYAKSIPKKYEMTINTQAQQSHQPQNQQCFCCMGQIQENQSIQIQQPIPHIQIEKGQKLLTSHQQLIKKIQKQRQRQRLYNQQMSNTSNNNNKQFQSNLSKYFNFKPSSKSHNIEQQKNVGFKCSECYRRICSECVRKCVDCNKPFCKFDYEDENMISKHRCYC